MFTAKYARSCDHAHRRERELVLGRGREDGRGSERRERERADVEQDLVHRRAAGAPLHRTDRDRQRQRATRPEQRGAGEHADRAHGERALVDDLERECLRRSRRARAGRAGRSGRRCSRGTSPATPASDADQAHGGDEHDQPRLQREEPRPLSACGRGCGGVGSAGAAAGPPTRSRRAPPRAEAPALRGRAVSPGWRRARGCGPGASRGRRPGRPGGSSSFESDASIGNAATPIETVARIGSLEVSTSKLRRATARRMRSAISSACSGVVSGSRMRTPRRRSARARRTAGALPGTPPRCP